MIEEKWFVGFFLLGRKAMLSMNVSKPIFRGQAKPIGGEQNKFLGEEMP
jgi:hypothetical protein